MKVVLSETLNRPEAQFLRFQWGFCFLANVRQYFEMGGE